MSNNIKFISKDAVTSFDFINLIIKKTNIQILFKVADTDTYILNKKI
ncbi:hypothetical protein DSUL_40038 [Desulfovibrionales bacterium]